MDRDPLCPYSTFVHDSYAIARVPCVGCTALAAARREALERAAGVCDERATKSQGGEEWSARGCAAAIRALIPGVGGDRQPLGSPGDRADEATRSPRTTSAPSPAATTDDQRAKGEEESHSPDAREGGWGVSKFKRPLAHYPIRRCRTMHDCCRCKGTIRYGEDYYDGGYGYRAHLVCPEQKPIPPRPARGRSRG